MAIARLFVVAILVLAICQFSSAGRVKIQSNRAKKWSQPSQVAQLNVDGRPFVVADDILHVIEDETEASCIDVLSNDVQFEDDLDVSTLRVDLAENGAVSFGENQGELCYTPNANFFGRDSFLYSVCDFNEDCQEGIVRVIVVGVNDAPLTRDDTATVEEDEYFVIADVLANDEDVDGRYIRRYSLQIVESPKFGKAEVTRDNRIVYTPQWSDKIRFHDVDTLIYQICDNEETSLCSYSTLTVTVKDKCIACEKCEDFVPTFNLHRDRVDHFFHSKVLAGSP